MKSLIISNMKTFNTALFKKNIKFFCEKTFDFPESYKKNYQYLLNSKKTLLEEIFPKEVNNASLIKQFSKISYNLNLNDKEEVGSLNKCIYEPGWNYLLRKGKMWRPILGLNIAEATNIRKCIDFDIVTQLMLIVEVLHNASLIIDDIEDKSEMRRGEKCLHLIYDEAISINVGVGLYYIPIYNLMNKIEELYPETNNKIVGGLCKAYLEELTAIHLGQGMDIEMKYTRVPNNNTYIDVVLCKTGVFLRLIAKWILRIIEIDNKNKIAFKSFEKILLDAMDYLSVAFQIKDDLLNIKVSEVSKTKGKIGEDITEGKQSLMVLNCLNLQNSYSKRLKEIILMKTNNVNLINEAIEILIKSGSVEYAEIKMKEYFDLFNNCINLLENNEFIVNKNELNNIRDIGSFLVNRI